MSYAFDPAGVSPGSGALGRSARAVGELSVAELIARLGSANDKAALLGATYLDDAARAVPAGFGKSAITRLAASPKALGVLKFAAPIAAVSAVPAAGDVLFGGDSAANKIMDGAGMTIGGILGSVGGPVGAAAGAGIGKSASDGLQWLFGDKKTAEQRRMEEALMALRGGVI